MAGKMTSMHNLHLNHRCKKLLSQRCSVCISLSILSAGLCSHLRAEDVLDRIPNTVGSRETGFSSDAILTLMDREPFIGSDEGPNIEDPGPDLGNFPNSAATLKKGRAYIEMAPFSLSKASRSGPAAYNWPFLLRYGVTDALEFRLFGNGLTSNLGDNATTGFSPLAFDMKVHLWDDKIEILRPAASLEVYIQTDWASSAFRGGTQPGLALNFDLPLLKRTNLEWTIAYSGVQDVVDVATGQRTIPALNNNLPLLQHENLNEYRFSFLWAVERKVT